MLERGADLGTGAAHVDAVLDAVRLLGERNRGGVVTQQRVEVRLGDADDDVARVVALGIAHRAFGVRVLGHVGAEDGIDLVDEPVAHQEALGDVGGDPGVGSTGGAGRARHVGVDVVEHDDVLAVDHPAAVTRARQRLAPEDVADRVGAFHHHLRRCAGDGRRARAARGRRPG